MMAANAARNNSKDPDWPPVGPPPKSNCKNHRPSMRIGARKGAASGSSRRQRVVRAGLAVLQGHVSAGNPPHRGAGSGSCSTAAARRDPPHPYPPPLRSLTPLRFSLPSRPPGLRIRPGGTHLDRGEKGGNKCTHERRTHGKAAPLTGLLNTIPSRPTAGGFVHTKRTARHQKDRSTTEGSNQSFSSDQSRA